MIQEIQVNPLGLGTICDSGNVRFAIMELTPEDARAILTYRMHPNQRPINKRQVARFLKSMLGDNWEEPPYTFDVLAFDTEGRVVNGQHRLWALARQSKAMRFLVLFGIEVPKGKALPSGDTGTARPKWLVEGEPKVRWQIANFLLTFAQHNHEARAEAEVVKISRWIDEACERLPRSHRTIPTPVRAAFVVQWMLMADNPDRQSEVERNWREYSQMNMNELGSEYSALLKRLTGSGIAKGETDRDVQFACTMYAMNNPGAVKIYVNVSKARIVTAELMRRNDVLPVSEEQV